MFRLVELSGGKISIDGIDISQLGLADLRSKIASKELFAVILASGC
jgi:ATP-binding cassette, subfamily C (CFTR/MRP), member 1